MKRKFIVPIVGILNEFFVFIYCLSLVNGKIAFMKDKSIFIQFVPLAVSLVIAILCEAHEEEDK